jgi:hypothetical protein
MVVQQFTNFTAYLIAKGIEYANGNNSDPIKFLVCGGGRKNDYLINSIKNYLSHKKNISLNSIDDYSLEWRLYRIPSIWISCNKIIFKFTNIISKDYWLCDTYSWW